MSGLHQRQSSKLFALQLLAAGNCTRDTFKHAASFGYVTDSDYQQIINNSPFYKPSKHTKFYKDHMYSRFAAFEDARLGGKGLHLSVLRAIGDYMDRYDMPNCPTRSMREMMFWNMALVCGHPANAELLSESQNSRKGANCSHTLEQLGKKIAAWEFREPVPKATPIQLGL